MASSIEKEKNKKKRQKRNKILLIVGACFFLYIWIHFRTVCNMDKRLGISDMISQPFIHAFTEPLEYDINTTDIIIGIAIIGVAFMFMSFRKADKELRKHDNPETVNGEAHLMTLKELENYQTKFCDPIGKSGVNGPNNMILSKEIRLAIDGKRTRRNCNVLCIGGSGAGKTRFFGAPNILQFNSNFVITDPSGELLNDYAKALENAGYEILVFNITDVYRSNRYNPFHYIREEKDVFILVNTLIKNTTPPDAHVGDPIWENGEKLILEAIILYLWHTAPEDKQTFESVVKMINMAEIDENDATVQSPLDILFHDLEKDDPDNLAVEQYKSFKIAAGKTMKSFLISVATRLQTFKLSDIRYLTSTDDFHFEEFSDKKKALFVILPTAETTFNFIVSMLYSQLFASLYDYVENRVTYGWCAKLGRRNIIHVEQAKDKQESKAAKERITAFVESAKKAGEPILNKEKKYWEIRGADGRLIGWRGTKEAAEAFRSKLQNLKIARCERHCPWHVRFILDEFANIGQIPDFSEKLATIRKYEISCSIIIQALSQLKDLYKDKWNTIAANCDTKLFLGCDDSETIEWLLKMLGKKTTTVEQTSYQAGKNGGGSTSYSKSSLDILTIDQITMMQEDECLVRIRAVRPHYGKKFELTKHPNYHFAEETQGMFEIPISEEAILRRDRNRGPLRERKANLTMLGAESAKTSEDAPEIQKRTQEDIDKENKERKAAADQELNAAAEALKAMEKSPSAPILDERLAQSVCDAFGTKEADATDEAIREAVETLIDLQLPSFDTMTYGMTG